MSACWVRVTKWQEKIRLWINVKGCTRGEKNLHPKFTQKIVSSEQTIASWEKHSSKL